jgi:hypothetical protein
MKKKAAPVKSSNDQFKLDCSKIDKIAKQDFGHYIQQAIELEIATIPVYLYTYYSIKRTPDQDQLIEEILQDLPTPKNEKEAKELKAKAKELAIEIQVFANKAGALIMSVAVEEMLHMALSSNVKQALVGPPDLINKTPASYPAFLPGHEPEFPINLDQFSLAQLETFLLIESPDAFTKRKSNLKTKAKKQSFKYDTIGDFYTALMCCVKNNFSQKKQYSDRPQLAPGKGYYAQNNTDTVYYDQGHNPHFTSADDSGDLVHVVDMNSALEALHEVAEQGEGNSGGHHLDERGNVPDKVCEEINSGKYYEEDYDDKDREELSHFAKFLSIYCKLKSLKRKFQDLTNDPDFNVEKYFIYNVPKNPKQENYPDENIKDWSNLGNAATSYLFLMTQACYHNGGARQFEIFMFGIHKAMIWVLALICTSTRELTYQDKHGNTVNGAVTFEPYDFSKYEGTPKEQLIALSKKVNFYGTEHIENLPNVYLNTNVGVNKNTTPHSPTYLEAE